MHQLPKCGYRSAIPDLSLNSRHRAAYSHCCRAHIQVRRPSRIPARSPVVTKTNTDVSRHAIEEWLRGRAAFYLVLPADRVDSDAKLVGYGLDSADALSICTEIED